MSQTEKVELNETSLENAFISIKQFSFTPTHISYPREYIRKLILTELKAQSNPEE